MNSIFNILYEKYKIFLMKNIRSVVLKAAIFLYQKNS